MVYRAKPKIGAAAAPRVPKNLIRIKSNKMVDIKLAIWLMRTNQEYPGMYSVLTEKEAFEIVVAVNEELNKAGYKIIKKDNNE